MTGAWTRTQDIVARVRRRWTSGELLRAYAAGEPFEPLVIALRGPTVGQIGDDLAAVSDWVAELDAGRRDETRYSLRWRAVGGRSIGRNQLPSHATIDTREQAWTLLGVGAQVRRFDALLEAVGDRDAVRDWLVARPLQALELADELPALVAAFDWFEAHRGSGSFLREISAPGVDTKFAERHRAVLARMLGVSAQPSEFLAGLGLASPPSLLHLRFEPSSAPFAGLSEVAARVDELAGLDVRVRRVLIVENRITYLSVPVPAEGVVVWGQGFDVAKAVGIPWIAGADVAYWGDLDPHGFEILDLLRRHLPWVRSVLMDRETLLHHRDRWVTDRTGTPSSDLPHLTPTERQLHHDLVTDRLGERVRLEQERIDWQWALAVLTSRRGSFPPAPWPE